MFALHDDASGVSCGCHAAVCVLLCCQCWLTLLALCWEWTYNDSPTIPKWLLPDQAG
jgi:hypothetical protein